VLSGMAAALELKKSRLDGMRALIQSTPVFDSVPQVIFDAFQTILDAQYLEPEFDPYPIGRFRSILGRRGRPHAPLSHREFATLSLSDGALLLPGVFKIQKVRSERRFNLIKTKTINSLCLFILFQNDRPGIRRCTGASPLRKNCAYWKA
jgi:hypothetical protein